VRCEKEIFLEGARVPTGPRVFCLNDPSRRICVPSTVFPTPETPTTIVVDPSKIPPPIRVSITSMPITDRIVLDVGCIERERRGA
jgi:hypothetical protein